MYPVFCRLPDKVLLTASCRGVAFHGTTSSADSVIQTRELDDKSIVVVPPKRLGAETGSKDGLEVP